MTQLSEEPLLAAARVMRPVSRPTDSPPNPSCYQAGAFHPSGRLLITAEVDSSHVAADVNWVTLPGNKPMLTLPGREPTLSVWDVQLGWAIRSTGGHPARIICVGLDPEGNRVLVGGETRMELPKGPAPRRQSGRSATSGPPGGAMRAYDLATGDLLETYSRGESAVVAVCWGSRLISSIDRGNVLTHRPVDRPDLASRRAQVKGNGQGSQGGSQTAFSADGTRAMALSDQEDHLRRSEEVGSVVRLWDAVAGSARAVTDGVVVHAIALTPDGRQVATAEPNGYVRLRGFEDFKATRTLTARDQQGIIHLSFDPDGRRLAAATVAGEVSVWDVADGRVIASGRGPGGHVLASLFLAKQVRFATAGSHPNRPIPAQQLQVWDLGIG